MVDMFEGMSTHIRMSHVLLTFPGSRPNGLDRATRRARNCNVPDSAPDRTPFLPLRIVTPDRRSPP